MMQELNYIRLLEENRPISRFGRMHREYLRGHHPIRFDDLCLNGELWTYLADLRTSRHREPFGGYYRANEDVCGRNRGIESS